MPVRDLNSVPRKKTWSLRIRISVQSQQVYLQDLIQSAAVGWSFVEFIIVVNF